MRLLGQVRLDTRAVQPDHRRCLRRGGDVSGVEVDAEPRRADH
eukprot:CAMPEP_0180185926 /NCGR_PEP_ID=MMETSP0986-20121125/42673_1 /TAXON_ID=697907 /ORGANISM="non described non described, Strain CCMP2293" /LENGTH=42 /DNA_ID= /DNA_START= /DNA_END= /DNA_ORIENTATION=